MQKHSHILSINLRYLFLEWFSAIEEPIWMKEKQEKNIVNLHL